MFRINSTKEQSHNVFFESLNYLGVVINHLNHHPLTVLRCVKEPSCLYSFAA